MIGIRILLVLALLIHGTTVVDAAERFRLPGDKAGREYVCPPCPHVDKLSTSEVHAKPGTCAVCGMTLVERPALAEPSPSIHEGAGAFQLRVGTHGSRTVDVFYYRPSGLTADSPVLIVLPGAGRNAWNYRDHWKDAADRHGVLVLALHYPEGEYEGFWNYNIASMITDVVIDRAARALSDYRIVTDRERWLFDDVDHVFNAAARGAGLGTEQYDLFGHSAGGQFLHRFAMFASERARANRILASNSGWYTVPVPGERFPFGLDDLPVTESQLRAAFARKLVVFLGGSDDENETRGDLVRSAQTDRQGLHRLARGKHFFETSDKVAAAIPAQFNWTLVVVPGIGHDPKGMSMAAAQYLYGDAPGKP